MNYEFIPKIKKYIESLIPESIDNFYIYGYATLMDCMGEHLRIELSVRHAISGVRSNTVYRIPIIKEFAESNEYQEMIFEEAKRKANEMMISILIFCNNERKKGSP